MLASTIFKSWRTLLHVRRRSIIKHPLDTRIHYTPTDPTLLQAPGSAPHLPGSSLRWLSDSRAGTRDSAPAPAAASTGSSHTPTVSFAELAYAITHAQDQECERMLNGVSEGHEVLREKDHEGHTLLHLAVKQNNILIVRILLIKLSEMDTPNIYDITPFYFICENGLEPLFNVFLAERARRQSLKPPVTVASFSLSKPVKDNWTPFMGAVYANRTRVATLLLDLFKKEMKNNPGELINCVTASATYKLNVQEQDKSTQPSTGDAHAVPTNNAGGEITRLSTTGGTDNDPSITITGSTITGGSATTLPAAIFDAPIAWCVRNSNVELLKQLLHIIQGSPAGVNHLLEVKHCEQLSHQVSLLQLAILQIKPHHTRDASTFQVLEQLCKHKDLRNNELTDAHGKSEPFGFTALHYAMSQNNRALVLDLIERHGFARQLLMLNKYNRLPLGFCQDPLLHAYLIIRTMQQIRESDDQASKDVKAHFHRYFQEKTSLDDFINQLNELLPGAPNSNTSTTSNSTPTEPELALSTQEYFTLYKNVMTDHEFIDSLLELMVRWRQPQVAESDIGRLQCKLQLAIRLGLETYVRQHLVKLEKQHDDADKKNANNNSLKAFVYWFEQGNEHDRSMFYEAAFGGSVAILQLLIDKYSAAYHKLPADPKINDGKKVDVAVQIKTLLGKQTTFGWTPMMIAVKQNEQFMVEYLLNRWKVSANDCNQQGQTLLYFAVQQRNHYLVRLLINHGAELCSAAALDTCGETPLHVAARDPESYDILEMLLKAKHDQNDLDHCTKLFRRTALHEAAFQNNAQSVELLLLHGANPACVSHHGWTPAGITGHPHTRMMLQDALNGVCNHTAVVPTINLRSPPSHTPDGMAPIANACRHSRADAAAANLVYLAEKQQWSAIQKLLVDMLHQNPKCNSCDGPKSNNIDLNYRDSFGNTALHYACRHGDVDTVFHLLRLGAFPLSLNRVSATPIYEACANGHHFILTLFPANTLQFALQQQTEHGWTPMVVAVHNNHIEVVKSIFHFTHHFQLVQLNSSPSKSDPGQVNRPWRQVFPMRELFTRAIKNDSANMMKLFQKKGEDIEPQDLFHAVQYHAQECLEHIIDTLLPPAKVHIHKFVKWRGGAQQHTAFMHAVIHQNLPAVRQFERLYEIPDAFKHLASQCSMNGHTVLELAVAGLPRGQQGHETKIAEIVTTLSEKLFEHQEKKKSDAEEGTLLFHIENARENLLKMKSKSKGSSRKRHALSNDDFEKLEAQLKDESLNKSTLHSTFKLVNDPVNSSTLYHELARFHWSDQQMHRLHQLIQFSDHKVNVRGETLLYRATFHNNFDLSMFLVKQGCNPFIRRQHGWSPFHLAIYLGNNDILKVFIDVVKNEKIKQKLGHINMNSPLNQEEFSRSPLHLAVMMKNKVALNLLLTLNDKLPNGQYTHPSLLLDLNFTDIDGLTPLHYACRNGCIDCAQSLINYGADLHSRSHAYKGHMTPLHYAVRRGYDKIVSLLLTEGASAFERTWDDRLPIELLLSKLDKNAVGRSNAASIRNIEKALKQATNKPTANMSNASTAINSAHQQHS